MQNAAFLHSFAERGGGEIPSGRSVRFGG